jgi:membrane fusion protein (multidrug efflux system)
VAVLAWLAHFAYGMYHYEETDDAMVAGRMHQVSAQSDGTVAEVLAADNQTVKKGDILARLDPLEFQLMVQGSEASLARSRAEETRADAGGVAAEAALSAAKARAAAAAADVAQAGVQLDFAGINRTRARQLFGDGGAVTQSEVDSAESAYAAADAARTALSARARVADSAVAEAAAAVESARAAVLASKGAALVAESAIADSRRRLSYATVAAPADGRLGNRNVEVGNRVQAGQVLFALVEPERWVVANLKETQLARVTAGLRAEVTVDALPGLVLHGTVDSVAPASGAQFALLPPDNATGNFTKVVQRVPVKVLLDRESLEAAGDRLRPGLSAVVSIRVR